MDIRIYYEDTDAAGVVYHASYLKFFERARTEYFRERHLKVSELAAQGHIFPVVRMEIDFKAPARHDDKITVYTMPKSITRSTITMKQQIRAEDGRLLVDAIVTLACVSQNLKAHRIPDEVKLLFTDLNEESAP